MSADTRPPDLATLLAPLDDAAPTGPDLRQDVSPSSLYFRLRDARAEARAEERAGEYDPSLVDAGARPWSRVGALAIEALEQTRDLEVAAWLTESLVRSHGLPGLSAGAGLLAGLVTRFWQRGLHPHLDEDAAEARGAVIGGLSGAGSDGTLAAPLRRVVLFERADGKPLTFWQFEQAEQSTVLAEAERRKRFAAGVPDFAELEAEARGAAAAALAERAAEAIAAEQAWQALGQALSETDPDAAPSMRRVAELLAGMVRSLRRYVPKSGVPDDPGIAAPVVDGAAPAPGASAMPRAKEQDREALLGELTRIAALFRLREPNSPLGYTLDDAVRRARLAWPELLREMLPDSAPRSALLSSLGIRPAAE